MTNSTSGTDLAPSLSASELYAGMRRSALLILIIGVAVAALFAIISVITTALSNRESTLRIQFLFPGAEKRRYEDGRTFLATDLIAPDVVAQAAGRVGLADAQLIADLQLGLSLQPIVTENEKNTNTEPTIYDLHLKVKAKHKVDETDRVRFLTALIAGFNQRLIEQFVRQPSEIADPFLGIGSDNLFESSYIVPIRFDIMERFIQTRQSSPNLSLVNQQKWRDHLVEIRDYRRLRLSRALASVEQLPRKLLPINFLRGVQYQISSFELRSRQLISEQEQLAELMRRVEASPRNYVPIQTDRSAPTIDPNILKNLVENDAYSKLVRDSRQLVSELSDTQKQIAELKGLLDAFPSSDGAALVSPPVVMEELQSARTNFQTILSEIQNSYLHEQSQAYEFAVRQVGPQHSDNPLRTALLLSAVGFCLGIASVAGFLAARLALRTS